MRESLAHCAIPAIGAGIRAPEDFFCLTIERDVGMNRRLLA